MRVLIFGATGMVGLGVLKECLRPFSGVTGVVSVGRSLVDPDQLSNSLPLQQLTLPDLFDLSPIAEQLHDIDACYFCLGVSSFGMSEQSYRHITYDLTLSIAQTVVRTNPKAVFIYVSGAGTDSTEKGRSMWARVKGETENALRHVGFRAVYLFRPGMIVPGKGIRSKTFVYQIIYDVLKPVLPWMRRTFPRYVTSTAQVGRAMLQVTRNGYPKPVLEQADINSL